MNWEDLDKKAVKTRKEFNMQEGDSFGDYAFEMNQTVSDHMSDMGLAFYEEQPNVRFDGDPLEIIDCVSTLTQLVHTCYEGDNVLCFKEPLTEEQREANRYITNIIWDEYLGCSGDDDVDYSGSYIDIILDAIREVVTQ